MTGLRTGFSERPPAPPEAGGFGGGGGGDWGASRRIAMIGLAALIGATSMVFLSLAGAFLYRREDTWAAVPLPPILWANTLVLLISSGLVEAARRALKSGRRDAFNIRWTAAAACGVLFLLGQAVAWRQVHAAFTVTGNPGVAFFYLAAGTHAFHVLGGLTALVWVDVAALRFELGPARRTGADLAALFWHFLAGLWVCLMALLSLWA